MSIALSKLWVRSRRTYQDHSTRVRILFRTRFFSSQIVLLSHNHKPTTHLPTSSLLFSKRETFHTSSRSRETCLLSTRKNVVHLPDPWMNSSKSSSPSTTSCLRKCTSFKTMQAPRIKTPEEAVSQDVCLLWSIIPTRIVRLIHGYRPRLTLPALRQEVLKTSKDSSKFFFHPRTRNASCKADAPLTLFLNMIPIVGYRKAYTPCYKPSTRRCTSHPTILYDVLWYRQNSKHKVEIIFLPVQYVTHWNLFRYRATFANLILHRIRTILLSRLSSWHWNKTMAYPISSFIIIFPFGLRFDSFEY